jgi:Zn-finger nucleic acid-binding protein
MSQDILKQRGQALEEEFFARKNKEALERLANNLTSDKKMSPITGKQLTPKVIQGIHVFECEESKGLWIDSDELRTLKTHETEIQWDQRGLLKVAQEEEGNRPSPVTGKPMTKLQVGEIVLDFCEESKGVWFDSHELSKFIESSHTSENQALHPWVNLFYKAIGYK